MEQFKKLLIEKAIREHNEIIPVAQRSNFDECFTVDDGKLLFWFNTRKDESTKMVLTELEN